MVKTLTAALEKVKSDFKAKADEEKTTKMGTCRSQNGSSDKSRIVPLLRPRQETRSDLSKSTGAEVQK